MHTKFTKAVQRSVERQEIPPVSSHSCVVCERQAENYHHWSYEDPYIADVIPLCASCHNKVTRGVIYLNVGAVKHVLPSYEFTDNPSENTLTPSKNYPISISAISFLDRLYNSEGQLEPSSVWLVSKKEPPGRIRIAIPSKNVRNELLAAGIILRSVSAGTLNGYMLDIEKYPTRHTLPHF